MPTGCSGNAAIRQIHTAAQRTTLAQRRLQLPRVPAGLVGHDGHAQAGGATRHSAASFNHRLRSKAMFNAPACQVLPLSTLLTHTSAGAKSAPSIL